MNKKNQVVKGMLLSAIASLSWGISGTTLQLISQNLSIPGPWMFSIRTFIVGAALLIFAACKYRGRIFDVFKNKASCLSIISYAILGLALNLTSFYYSIQEGNASTATILQYLAPLFIMAGGILFKHYRPLRSDVLAFVCALIGVVLVTTKGDFSHLAIPVDSLLWGIGSGLTAAFYVVLPQRANRDNPSIIVLGWGTAIASLFFNCFQPFWVGTPKLTPVLVASVLTVCLFGTIIPFLLLLAAADHAPSDVISIMDAIQPILTTILSVIFFKLKINFAEMAGIVIVLIAIYLLQWGRRRASLQR
ncbi:drug/metabolite transporter permease [Lactobacillus corticis]|uniref:Drug/metabolite transporter permease n=2 Tax=Lactobacillus corticis TaxID=2201249 RepID=A0A916VHE3_9LACO|nr:DMT family transporter [Lactobacillus corticis]GFZ26956.1 drug/metabolite transporter permease [Lactobacillus corticis]